MVSSRFKMAVREVLNISAEVREKLRIALLNSGFELMDDKRAVLIERAGNVITEMIHYSEKGSKVNYSDHLSAKLNYDYTYLSNLFSEAKGITIQKFKEWKKPKHRNLSTRGF